MGTTVSTTMYGPCEFIMDYRSLARRLQPGTGLCLELGARRAALKRAVEAQGYTYVSVDIDHYPQLSVVGDAHRLPFKDDAFDLVLMPCVLEHFRNPEVAIEEVYRITKKGGTILGSVAFLEPFHKSYFHFSHAAVEEALRVAGFSGLMIDTGANAFLLIYARLFSSLLGIENRKTVSRLSRVLFPINLTMKCIYGGLWLKNAALRRDMNAFRGRFEAFRRELALRLAGHIIFSAEKSA